MKCTDPFLATLPFSLSDHLRCDVDLPVVHVVSVGHCGGLLLGPGILYLAAIAVASQTHKYMCSNNMQWTVELEDNTVMHKLKPFAVLRFGRHSPCSFVYLA